MPPYRKSHVLNVNGIFQEKIPLIVLNLNLQPNKKIHKTINWLHSPWAMVASAHQRNSCWCQHTGDFPENGKMVTHSKWKIQYNIIFKQSTCVVVVACHCRFHWCFALLFMLWHLLFMPQCLLFVLQYFLFVLQHWPIVLWHLLFVLQDLPFVL